MMLGEYLAAEQKRVDDALHRTLPAESNPPQIMHRAMRYSIFAGGKRIRPILCLAAAEAVSGHVPGIDAVACSLEMVHTYSLIHDDLPAMDNDDFRRGRPTCHKVFGEALAILAGDALLTLAFQVLTEVDTDADTKIRLIEDLAKASGTMGGMIAGQVHDIQGEGQQPTETLLTTIHHAKTGALLKASLRMGAIYAGADDEQLTSLSCYGEHVGLAFQIVDDLLDIEQSSETLGKTAGKDARQKKITFPAVYGLESSRRMAQERCVQAHRAIEVFGERGRRLREIADFIVSRKA